MRTLSRYEPIEHMVGMDGQIRITLIAADNSDLVVAGGSATWNLYVAVPRRARQPFKGNAVITKTSAASQITLSEGLAVVSIADTDLANRSGDFWQILKFTDGDGNITHFGQGEVRLVAAG